MYQTPGMGQMFKLVAPRAKRSLGWGGPLEMILFDGSPEHLVTLLAVPVLPQNTLKGPGARRDLKLDGQPPPGNMAQDQIAKLPRSTKRKADHIDASILFSDLPGKLHRLIFDHVEVIEDIICLSLTSWYFWGIGQDYIHKRYASFLGQWAGKNIVCVGEEAEQADYPPGLFSAKELHRFSQLLTRIPDELSPQEPWMEPFTLYHFSLPTISKIESDVDLAAESLHRRSHCRNRGDYHEPAFTATWSELHVTESTYLPKDQAWILRNLTTKEFVRSEAIALKPEFIDGPKITGIGFGEAVMARICWSAPISSSMEKTATSLRGVWAGHRFDITTVGRHKEETKGEIWRDASEEVVKEIAGIWERRYGPGWREKVCRETPRNLPLFG